MAITGTTNRGAEYESPGAFSGWVGLPVGKRLWDAFVERLDDVSPRKTATPIHEPPFRRSLIAAAALNSGAIEGLHGAGRGLTRLVIEHASSWEPHVRKTEGALAEEFVRGGIEGFDMALDVATGAAPLTEAWIRSLHEVVCAAQETVPVFAHIDGDLVRTLRPFARGTYKTDPNNVELADGTTHWYCPVADVPIEMGHLVAELRSPEFESSHPILQASFAHYAFVAIHPFQDGNGRVARIVASIFLLRAASIPFFVYEDERLAYFDALVAADQGDRQAFVNFVERVALDTLGQATDLARTSASPLTVTHPRDRIAADVSLAAQRLDAFIAGEFRLLGDEIVVGADVTKSWAPMTFARDERGADKRWLATNVTAQLRLESDKTHAGASLYFRVFTSETSDAPLPISVGVNQSSSDLEFRLEDLHPTLTTRAQLRVTTMIRRVVGELVRQAQDAINGV